MKAISRCVKMGRVILVISLIWAAMPLFAVEEEYDVLSEISLGELMDIEKYMVSIATGIKQTVARAPAVTTVITAHDIEATGADNLHEVLATVQGLYVTYNFVGSPVYTIRGMSAMMGPEILMLVNGVRMNNSQGGTIGTTTLPALPTIARIEIIRGPGSAVYGADAFSGVISITTKTAGEIQGTEAGIRTGSFDTHNAWILHGDNWLGFDVMAALAYNTTDGHSGIIDSDAQTVFDGVLGTNASLAPGPYYVQEKHGYDAQLNIQRGNWRINSSYHGLRDRGNGAGATESVDPGTGQADRSNTALTYHNSEFTKHWDVTAQISYLRTRWVTRYIVFPPGAFGGAYPEGMIGKPGVSEQHSRLDVSGFYSRFDKHLIRLGSGYVYDDQYKVQESVNFRGGVAGLMEDRTDASDIFAPEVARDSWYTFLQDSWTINPEWEITAGIRYDDYSDFGSTTNPRTAIVWQPYSNFTTKLLYGHAFRAPSFNELFITNNPSSKGNPNLKPETVETWEVALSYQAFEGLQMALNLFQYNVEDKIIYVADDPNAPTAEKVAQNAAAWEGQGLEFETRWKISAKNNLLFNYAYQDSRDERTNKQLGTVPQHQTYLQTDWLLFPNWFLNTQLNWASDWTRPANDPRTKIDDYTTVNLTLRYKDIHKKRWNFAIGTRNLFDEDIRSPSFGPNASGVINIPNDYPMAGRSFWLELRYYF
ncbi:TonB-dependent receptor [Candidatus Parabeggiatoa sp. HSG14]|uniref:TonB-dependent receptor plug domain-containing protein n=1 Tax=Candidatus Parabeggiatoa sp. HSG14 TaxID=3055593 RepID=UPI0025A7CFAD|nr:TonB-dependent receptor [Thiotrichales bacterium HSG14]